MSKTDTNVNDSSIATHLLEGGYDIRTFTPMSSTVDQRDVRSPADGL